jgi:hypothetical protein
MSVHNAGSFRQALTLWSGQGPPKGSEVASGQAVGHADAAVFPQEVNNIVEGQVGSNMFKEIALPVGKAKEI